MKQLAGYVYEYIRQISALYILVISLALSVLIWVNYHYGLNDQLLLHHHLGGRLWRIYLLYFLTFAITWKLGFLINKESFPKSFVFWLLILLSPAIFALKVSIQVADIVEINDSYLNIILQWPLRSLTTVLSCLVLWLGTRNPAPFAGLQSRGFNARPYFLLLLMMIPLLVAAGFGHDFQHVYPKLQMVKQPMGLLQKIFFELSYGLDFFTIELFFRGFLVIIFIKYGGKKAILPMAAFYCTIHFGKPVMECISSYFGGMILGAVIYYTRSIWGGLIVHLGIAWLMEIIGVFAHR